MNDIRDFGDRIMTRYERARVVLMRLSKNIGDLTVPLAVFGRYHKDKAVIDAVRSLIESPTEIAEIFDLLIKTDMVEFMEFSKKEIEEHLESVEEFMQTIDDLKKKIDELCLNLPEER